MVRDSGLCALATSSMQPDGLHTWSSTSINGVRQSHGPLQRQGDDPRKEISLNHDKHFVKAYNELGTISSMTVGRVERHCLHP